MEDIRWKQRFSNYCFALSQLKSAVELFRIRELSLLEEQGVIQAFEYTHELAWNTMKDFFEYQGNFSIKGSRDATKEAFKNQLIGDGEIWMDMIQARNLTSHAYDRNMAKKVVDEIVNVYFEEFIKFEQLMIGLKND
ncbi:MAG: nucleotidyltransferase substrate binding protein [Arcobacteraceae bacterium]|nr:nucleotidyltransferase substrate binding protein [Arcobacteraceae bacterium]